jgi:hypothetical protein
MPYLNYLKKLNFVSYFLVTLLLLQLAYFIWSINKGFDFTDEAYSFLGFENPGEVNNVATYYTIIFNNFFGWIEVSIVHVRIIRLLLLIICGSVLGVGLCRWFRDVVTQDYTSLVNLFLFILCGSLLINANGSQSLTYNLSSNFLLQLIAGVFLYTFQRENKIQRLDLVLFFFLGIFLFLLFTVKFSNFILVSFPILLMLLYDKRNLKMVATYVGMMGLGGIMAGFFLFKGGLFEWLIDYKNTLSSLSESSTASIWLRYMEDYHLTMDSKIVDNGLIIGLSILLIILSHVVKNKTAKVSLAIGIAALTVFVTYNKEYYFGGVKYYYQFTGLYILLMFTLISAHVVKVAVDIFQKKSQPNSLIIVTAFLAFIPFCGSIGTSNLLSIQIIWYTSFIFGAMYLLLYLNGTYILNLLVIVVGVNATLQAISGLVYYPYRIDQTLKEETQHFSINVSTERVMVNPALRKSVESADRLISSKTNFSKGDPIFAFSADYGFVYLLKGVLPGWGWYGEKGTEAGCMHIRNTKLRKLDKMIFIMPIHYELDSIYRNCFKEMNILFPDNFVKIGDIPYSLEQVDRPLSIYAPKSMVKESSTFVHLPSNK